VFLAASGIGRVAQPAGGKRPLRPGVPAMGPRADRLLLSPGRAGRPQRLPCPPRSSPTGCSRCCRSSRRPLARWGPMGSGEGVSGLNTGNSTASD